MGAPVPVDHAEEIALFAESLMALQEDGCRVGLGVVVANPVHIFLGGFSGQFGLPIEEEEFDGHALEESAFEVASWLVAAQVILKEADIVGPIVGGEQRKE